MKGINFTEPLFHKVVSGEKTQMRRIVKPQPFNYYKEGKRYMRFIPDEKGCPITFHCEHCNCALQTQDNKKLYPRHKVGETLYLKEPYHNPNDFPVTYKYGTSYGNRIHWQPQRSMPVKYARYFIEITGVRCEQLQDISGEDCLREGIQEVRGFNPIATCYEDCVDKYLWTSPQHACAALIDQIYGKGTWDSNPYVWVYDFKLVKKNNKL